MPEKLYDYANFIKLRLVISLYCSRQRTIMYAVEVQAAEKWGVTPRRVNYYCAAGRISGAVKMATIWLIPKDAEKPIDGRTKQGKVKKYE